MENNVECKTFCVKERLQSSVLNMKIFDFQSPIVYTPEYDILFGGIERLYPFDTAKWGKVFTYLKEAGLVSDSSIIRPREVQLEDLLLVHSKSYLDELKLKSCSSKIPEMSSLALLPKFVVQSRILRPFRFQTGGSVLAANLALEKGWAINIGGGLHHCYSRRGGGFCPYADMTLTVGLLLEKVNKVMIVDLSAQQGNGPERDFMNNDRVYILDIYNRSVYPHDGFAKRGIDRKVELQAQTGDEDYLALVRSHLEYALNKFNPDVVVYNAGLDVLADDLSGCLAISPEGVIERDQIVFLKVRSRGIPIVMLSGGGFHRMAGRVMADSILNLHRFGLISVNHSVPKIPCSSSENFLNLKDQSGFLSKFRRFTVDYSASTVSNLVHSKSFSFSRREACSSDSDMENRTTHAADLDRSVPNKTSNRIQEDVCDDDYDDVRSDVCGYVRDDISNDVRENVSDDVCDDVCDDVRRDVCGYVRDDISNDVRENVSDDVCDADDGRDSTCDDEACANVCNDLQYGVCDDVLVEVCDDDDDERNDAYCELFDVNLHGAETVLEEDEIVISFEALSKELNGKSLVVFE